MKPANMAPFWVFLYPSLAEIARKHGYALAIHGSVGRDFDLIAVPWTEQPGDPSCVIRDIHETYAVANVLGPYKKLHGRLVWSISIVGSGEVFLDLSFMPSVKVDKG